MKKFIKITENCSSLKSNKPYQKNMYVAINDLSFVEDSGEYEYGGRYKVGIYGKIYDITETAYNEIIKIIDEKMLINKNK